eukprot:1827298-Pleurochrysis_carterae.AAC.1
MLKAGPPGPLCLRHLARRRSAPRRKAEMADANRVNPSACPLLAELLPAHLLLKLSESASEPNQKGESINHDVL